MSTGGAHYKNHRGLIASSRIRAKLLGMSAIGTKRTSACAPHMSAFDPKRTRWWVFYMIYFSDPSGRVAMQKNSAYRLAKLRETKQVRVYT
jgi:hypothetical protein